MSINTLTLTPVNPLGWLIDEGQITSPLSTAGGSVSYSVALTAGEKLALSASNTMGATGITLVNPAGQTATTINAASGSAAVLTPFSVTTSGNWTINVTLPVSSSGSYSLAAALNAGIEGNDTSAKSPLAIDSSNMNPGIGTTRFAWIGNSNPTSGTEVDYYTVNLTGKAGQPFNVFLEGIGTSFAGQRLDLIAPNGNVVATATPDAGPSTGLQPDLRISNCTLPVSGVYTIRLTSSVAGNYGLVVSQSTASEAVLGYAAAQSLTTLPTASALLNTLSFSNVFVSMSTEELLGSLIRYKIVNAASSVSALETIISNDGISLTNLRPDGVMTALATAPGGSLLLSGGAPTDALTAKGILQTDFNSDVGTFLDVFSARDLLEQFDNSITSTAGAAVDPLYAVSTYSPVPIPSTAPNVVTGYSLWFTDTNGATNVPTPAAAVSGTNAMPAGQHDMVSVDFVNVAGYGEGTYPGEGYLDPVDGNGNPAQYYMVWMDQWEKAVQQRITTFFTQFKQLGGTLDSFTLDVELNGLGYWDLATQNRQINPSGTPTQSIWQEMLSDPRWPALRAQLIAAGIPANDLALQNISNWSIQSTDASIWDAVAETRLAGYLNQAIYQPIHTLFPNAVVSNYDNANRSQTIPTGIYWEGNGSPFTTGSVVGNAQSKPLYGWDTYVSTPTVTYQPNPPFQTPIQSVAFTQFHTGTGQPTTGGDVTVTFASPVTGFKVGDTITVLNRGGDWIDPQYTGTFQIASVAANGTSLVYIDMNTSAINPPTSYNLTDRLNAQNTSYVGSWSAYNAFVDEVNLLRSEVATSNVPLAPWISAPDWLLLSNGENFTYYSELVFQAALSGANDFRLWISSTDTNTANPQLVSNLLAELDPLVGFAGGKTISYTGVNWSDNYVMTGMDVDGRRIYRLTPNPGEPVTIISTSPATFLIGGQTVTIPNSSIYKPPVEYSNLGYWIVQTAGTTNLVGGFSKVLAQVESVLEPTTGGAAYTLWADNFGRSVLDPGYTGGDFNGDGVVNGADYTVWADGATTANSTAKPANANALSMTSQSVVPQAVSLNGSTPTTKSTTPQSDTNSTPSSGGTTNTLYQKLLAAEIAALPNPQKTLAEIVDQAFAAL